MNAKPRWAKATVENMLQASDAYQRALTDADAKYHRDCWLAGYLTALVEHGNPSLAHVPVRAGDLVMLLDDWERLRMGESPDNTAWRDRLSKVIRATLKLSPEP